MTVFPVKDFDHQILSKIDAIRMLISHVKLSTRAVVPDVFLNLLDDVLGEVRNKFISEIEDIREAAFDNEHEEITKQALTYMALLRELHDNLFLPKCYTRNFTCGGNLASDKVRNVKSGKHLPLELLLIKLVNHERNNNVLTL